MLFVQKSFGFYNGSCSSQGEWVTAALTQAESIREAVETLKNDPNCTGIESAVQALDVAQATGQKNKSQFVQSYSQLNREIRDLRMMSAEGNSDFKQRVVDILMNKVVGEADVAAKSGRMMSLDEAKGTAQNINNLDQRVALALDTMFTGANDVLKVLPNLRSCFNNRPNESLALFAGLVRLGGAVVDGGEGVTSRAGGFIANLVSFVRNDQYAKVLSQIDEKEYWTSMSCLIETSAQAYCTAKDAYVILEDQKKLRLDQRTLSTDSDNSPLRGYYLLVREIPRVSEWLQRVLIGLPPQMNSQADFQKSVIDSIQNLTKDKLSLEGHYSENLQTYQNTYSSETTDQVIRAKRAFVVKLLSELVSIMYGGRADNGINFFAMTIPDSIAPFALLGVDMPEELRQINVTVTWKQYIERNIDTYAPLSNPDNTILQIKINMDQLLQTVLATGTNYYANWFIPDATRVVDEAISMEPPNILQSLKNINNYIDQSIERYVVDWDSKKVALENEIRNLSAQFANGDLSVLSRLNRQKKLYEFYTSTTVLPSLVDTRMRITRVIQIFEQRELQIANRMNDLENFVTLDKELKDEYFLNLIDQIEKDKKKGLDNTGDIASEVMDALGKTPEKELKVIDQEILSVAFAEFNVMLQRDTFLFNRFYNYILSEYMERVQSEDEQNLYLRDLLAVTGRNLINRFVSINRMNPNSTGLDLAQAHPINLENLEALEQLLYKDFKVSICKITLRIGGTDQQMSACECLVRSNGESSNAGWGGCRSSRFLSSGSNIDNVLKGDDEFGSYAQLKAKYCIQALSFPTRWSEFQEICEGATIVSQFSEEAKIDRVNVDASFSDYAKNFASQDKSSDRICALRDYIRRNQVYWLLNKNVY